MPSPFPGMDPNLESPAFWPDFHARFIPNWCDYLVDLLPDNYDIRIDERVQIAESDPETATGLEPDLNLSRSDTPPVVGTPSRGVATLEPMTFPLAIQQPIREIYLRVFHRPSQRVITVMELLSPSNKYGRGRRAYLDRRDALHLQGVQMVEIDLLLKGRRLPVEGTLPMGDYFTFVSRPNRDFTCDVFSWQLRDPLPRLPIPLLGPDSDIVFDLGELFRLTYDRGRYHRSIDYTAPPPVPLNPADTAWLHQQIAMR